MARPPKYLTPEDRLAARRQQVRNNVRAFRERRLGKKHSSGDGEAESASEKSTRPSEKASPPAQLPPPSLLLQSPFLITSHDIDDKNVVQKVAKVSEEVEEVQAEPHTTTTRETPYYTYSQLGHVEEVELDQQAHANDTSDPTALTRYTPSPISTDIVQHSNSSPLDLSFGYFEAIVREGDAWVSGYPFWESLQRLRSDELVVISVLSATAAGFGILGKDKGLARQSRESYQIGLQKLRERLSLVGSVKADEEGLGMMYANYSLVSVEFCENLWSGWDGLIAPWILHLRAGFAMMDSAGPVGFRDATGLMSLRSMRSRIVFAATLDEEPCFLDNDDWREIPYTLLGRRIDDVIWNLIETIPAHAHRCKVLIQQGEDASIDEIKQLYHDLLSLRTRFTTWFSTFYNQHPDPPFSLQPAAFYNDEFFNQCFSFTDLLTGDTCASYWIYLFELSRRGLRLQTTFSTQLNLSPTSNHTILFTEQDLLSATHNLFRSAESIFFWSNRGFERLVRIFAPLRIVYDWLWEQPEQYDRELKWCWRVMQDISTREPQGGLAKHFTVSFMGEPRPPPDVTRQVIDPALLFEDAADFENA